MLDAWGDLSSERQVGMALGPIPYTTMVWYAERKGLDPEAVEDFCALLTAMDVAFLKRQNESKPSAGKQNKSRTRR